MIAYFIYSSISLALLLFIYRIFLEKEKRFTFNRVFLLWSLVFSFIIPMIPVGLAPLEIPWSALFSSGETASVTSYQNLEDLRVPSEVQATAIENNSAAISSEALFSIAFLLYITISVLLLIRLMRIIHGIQLKINGNSKRFIQGCEIVLLNENIVPHSFVNTVFLNKKQFESGKIPKEVLNHEFTHVRQKHSLDILFVEFLKIIFWFNPLLYLYKNAIALNHEYLADEAVISKGTIIKNYQRMLLNTMERNALHGLASSFNFSSTKRRLQMMTQSKTKVKFQIKLTMLVPLFAGLSLMLGCEPASNEISSNIESADEIRIEILNDNALLVNQKRMTLDELERLLAEIPESPGLVRMNVSPDAQFGVVTDVQSILKKYKAFIINYSSKKSREETSSFKSGMDEALQNLRLKTRAYLNIEPTESNSENLKASYDEIMESLKNFGDAQSSYYNSIGKQTPPLPPIPQKPEDRIKNN